MKLTKSFFAFLAMCFILIFAACEDGDGSSDSSGIGSSSGTKYVVTDLVDHTGVSNLKVVKGKGIEFKEEGGVQCKIYKTMTLTSNKKFTASYDIVLGGMPEQKFSASGTWSQSGSTITLKYSSGTETVKVSSNGKTLTDTGLEPNLHTYLIYTKQ